MTCETARNMAGFQKGVTNLFAEPVAISSKKTKIFCRDRLHRQFSGTKYQ